MQYLLNLLEKQINFYLEGYKKTNEQVVVISFMLGFFFGLLYFASFKKSFISHFTEVNPTSLIKFIGIGAIRVWILVPLFVFVAYKLGCLFLPTIAGAAIGGLLMFFKGA